VVAEEDVLDGDRRRFVLGDQVAQAPMDPREPSLERLGRRSGYNAPVEGGEPAATRKDDPIAEVGRPGVDAEHDHHRFDSAVRGGRLPRSKSLTDRGQTLERK